MIKMKLTARALHPETGKEIAYPKEGFADWLVGKPVYGGSFPTDPRKILEDLDGLLGSFWKWRPEQLSGETDEDYIETNLHPILQITIEILLLPVELGVAVREGAFRVAGFFDVLPSQD